MIAMQRRCATFVGLFLTAALCAFGAETPKFSGYAYVDYFRNLKSPDAVSDGLSGFQIRRIYFTCDTVLAANAKARFRLEANDGSLLLLPGAVSGARFDKDRITGLNLGASVFAAFVKDAYVQWDAKSRRLERFHPSLVLGIQPTPAFAGLEEDTAWKYRSLEKTILDRNKIVSSRDLGLGVKGAFDSQKRFGYWFLMGNDTTSPETNRRKRYYGLLSYQGGALLGELYGDFRERDEGRDEIVAKALVGARRGRAALSGVAFDKWAKDAAGETRLVSAGVSVFGRCALTRKLEAVLRGDVYDPNPNASDDAVLFGIAGLVYQPIGDVDIIPNVWVEKSRQPDSEPAVAMRTTVHYRF